MELALKKIAFLLPLFALLCACNTMIGAPKVSVAGLNVVSLDTAGAGMELKLQVQNPNPFELRLQGYRYDLEVVSFPLVRGEAREEVTFPAGGETEVRIPIRITFRDLVRIVKSKPDLNRIPYRLNAGLDVATPIGAMTVPVDRTGTYALPEKYRPATLFGKLTDFIKF